MAFVALEMGLKFDDFSWLPCGIPRPCEECKWGGPQPRYQTFVEPETDARGPEAKHGGLETELRVQRTQETGLQMILRSLVTAHKEGPAIFRLHE